MRERWFDVDSGSLSLTHTRTHTQGEETLLLSDECVKGWVGVGCGSHLAVDRGMEMNMPTAPEGWCLDMSAHSGGIISTSNEKNTPPPPPHLPPPAVCLCAGCALVPLAHIRKSFLIMWRSERCHL